jgi:putative hydrolase of HD superfamily
LVVLRRHAAAESRFADVLPTGQCQRWLAISITPSIEEEHAMSHSSPLEVVQAQLDAYNAKDIKALLASYSPNAQQYATGGEQRLIERTFPEGVGSIEMLCVCEVFDGRILRATFATGEKKLFAGPVNAS